MMSSDDSDLDVKPSKKLKVRRWSFLRLIGWGISVLLLILIIAGAYAWQNRYSFLEDAVERVLAEQGLQAQLSIQDIKKQSARLSNITVSADGKSVFSAEKLTIDYDWREALKGRMKRIELTGAVLALTVDEKGKIIDGWMPDSDSNSELVLPPQGLHLNNSQVTVQSPYGLVNAQGNLTFFSFEDLKADFDINPAQFSFGALSVKGGGRVKARLRPGENAITAQLDFTDMLHPLGALSYASVNADVMLDLIDGHSHVSGPVTLSFAELLSGTVTAENGLLNWDGSFSVKPNSAAIREADGAWAGEIGRMTYSDVAGQNKLASALTLNGALKAAPITTHFADSLTQTVTDLLRESDVSAGGKFLRFDDKVEVKLTRPLILKSNKAQLKVTNVESLNFYDYDRLSETIHIKANAALSGMRSVALSNMSLEARSPNGLSIADVSEFSASARTLSDWRAASIEGDVRLAPLTAKASYVNTDARREMTVDVSAIEYDGPLPGGYAKGLETAGRLSVDLRGGGLKTSFTPQDDKPIYLSRFQTPTGWTAENARFDLISRSPFYVRADSSANAALAARLENVTTMVSEAETGRKLDITLSAVDVSTLITATRQDWTLNLSGAEIETDDFGGIGTVVGADEAVVLATLAPETAPQIDLKTAAARVRTDQISTQNMKIALKGTPTNFHLDFGGESYANAGLVKFADETLPQLPLRGGLDYADGLMTGEAFTVLPKAEDADIDISFRMKDGEGTAKIDIARLTFAERGFQPQNLIPALQGKIANVAGTVSASIDIAFAPGMPLQSSGRAVLNNVDFGTLPGPFRGVNTAIEFSSVFPLVSSGVQRLTVDSFNPGVDLIDGVIEYELVPNGAQILSAKWPLANGFISLDPTIWKYDALENRVVLRIQDVSVGAFLGEAGGGGLTVTGDVVGAIPVVIAGVDVRIDQGRLDVENGGIIQYRSQELTSVVDLIPEKYVTLQDYNQFKEFQKKDDPNENAGKDLAFTALRNFEYKSLSAKLDGPLDGEMEVNVQFLGRNPKILAGTEFDFNITVVGELVNLVRSLKPDSSMARLKGFMDLDSAEREEVSE